MDARIRKLGIRHYLPGTQDKLAALRSLATQWGCEVRDFAYVGDDLTDAAALEAVGLACCPADAVAAIRARVDYVAAAGGGAGAVREVCDLLLAARD